MRVLVGCEFSGVVREAFRKLGHDAWSCDIIPADDNSPYHYQCDIFEVINLGWDLAIFHPPCTYLSNAGARFLYPKGNLNIDRLKKGLEARDFFMRLYYSNIPKICIENPVASTIYNLPKYTQSIQPYEHGHPFQKKTCLWLKNLPLIQPTNLVSERESTKVPGNWFNKCGKDRQKNRAKTFEGIAKAMAESWGNNEDEK